MAVNTDNRITIPKLCKLKYHKFKIHLVATNFLYKNGAAILCICSYKIAVRLKL